MNHIGLRLAGAFLVGVAIIALVFLIWERMHVTPHATLVRTIAEMQNGAERSGLYEELIEEAGLVEAQELLVRSGIPFDGESHLLNHVSGVYAYKNLGAEGILSCKDYFLQSCYHGFLIEFIVENGIAKIGDVIAVCDSAGAHIAGQCAHGIGHGLLAWVGYKNFPEAFEWCDRIDAEHPTLITDQCYNGVAMENNWAVHEGLEPSPDRWIDPMDPYFPCNDSRIKPEWQNACWQNQASIIFKHFGGDYTKTYEACSAVKDVRNRDACLNNLARQIHPGSMGDPERARMLCGIMETTDRNLCIARVAGSEYSVGGRSMPFSICAAEAEPSRELCYTTLFNIMRALTPKAEGALQYCGLVEHEGYRSACMNVVSKDTVRPQ